MYRERNPLPEASPESLGISSGNIAAFIEALRKTQYNMHGFMILRHGKIAAEAYYAPFRKEDRHRMYSTSKSFTAVAVGMLADEGKIRLNDKIASYFPEKITGQLHPYTADAEIRDLLMMASPFSATTYGFIDDIDWIRTYFTAKPDHRPGQVFWYETSATTVLAALVEKLTGMRLLDYLRSKGFDEMGFSEDAECVLSPDGAVSWTGSGILCRLRDLAKFALLCLNKGEYQGRQLVSREYMEQATSRQIDNGAYGYGYFFWMMEDGFCCRGLGGQMAYCFPEKDLILVTVGDDQLNGDSRIQMMETLFRQTVYDNIRTENLDEDPAACKALRKLCTELRIQTVKGQYVNPLARKVSGKTYRMTPPETERNAHFEAIRFDFEEDRGVLRWTMDGEDHALAFGLGHFEKQIFPGFASEEETAGRPILIYGYKGRKQPLYLPVYTSAAWQSDHELRLICYSIGINVGTLDMRFSFDENWLTVHTRPHTEWMWTELSGMQSGEASL